MCLEAQTLFTARGSEQIWTSSTMQHAPARGPGRADDRWDRVGSGASGLHAACCSGGTRFHASKARICSITVSLAVEFLLGLHELCCPFGRESAAILNFRIDRGDE